VAIPVAAGALYAWGIILTPAVGAALMAASTVIVAINARLLRLKSEPQSKVKVKPKSEVNIETKLKEKAKTKTKTTIKTTIKKQKS
jgi:Cu2+-exporting ATPase